MQENLTEWKEVEDLASISLRVFPSDWELIRTKPAEYADRIERRKKGLGKRQLILTKLETGG